MKQRPLFLRDILTILFKRKLLIISFAALVFAVVFVGNFVWPPSYESDARIRLMRGREVYQTDPTVLKQQEGVAMVQMSSQDVNSEIDLIRSNDVLETVVTDMKLDQPSLKKVGLLRQIYRTIKKSYLEALYALNIKNRPTDLQAATAALAKGIEIQPLRDSFLLDISLRLNDPKLAQDVLQKLLDVYISKRVQLFANKKNSPFFQEQMNRVESELKTAQDALKTFREQNKIVAVESEKTLLTQEYADLQKLLTQMQETQKVTQASAADGHVREDITAGDAPLVATLSRQTNSPVVTEMQMRLLETINERNRLSKSLGPKHPDIIAINKQIKEAQARLDDAINTTRATAQTKLADIEARMEKLNDVMAQLDNLERNVKVQSANLDYYAQKLEESRVSDAMADAQMSNVKIISNPTLSVDPVRPRKLFNLIFALVGGIIGGLALAFFLEYLDHGIKTPEDVECHLEIPVIGSFFRAAFKKGLDPNETERLNTLLEALVAEAPSAEAPARTGAPASVVAVASSVSGEGSQGVAHAIAESYAKDAGASILLIDLVGGATARKAKTSGRPGLTDVLLNQAELDKAIVTEGNLAVLGRGSQIDFPAAMWKSEHMQSLMNDLRGRFQRIVIHVGAILHSPDAFRIAQVVDGTIIVIQAEKTRREVVQRAIDMVKGAKANVLGAVLTNRKQRIPSMIYRRI